GILAFHVTGVQTCALPISNSAQVSMVAQPMVEPCVTTISSAARPTAIETMPAQSVLPGRPASGADSGICRISRIEATDTSAQMTARKSGDKGNRKESGLET